MSHLHPGDDDMHYCDNSHRWIAPPEMEQHVWSAQVRAHMQEHLRTMGGPPPAESRACVPPRQLYPAHVGRGVAAPAVRRSTRPVRTTASPGQRVVAVGRTTRDGGRDTARDRTAAK
ncbi:hypothetical protein [Virgisporangium ochraceum]|uniref:Uncharacterized protein n=1 Tax=Virgisporangium ochraceum TaxID=65505 RepID=A0A8J4ED15_9ACTN|nr:hypothetical protein [Virgisporangium ochraceum]GIJ70224.1 hypothetical protein Voc01_051410 [Virgisporangium ochraceum]